MIRFALRCDEGHSFDSWFQSAAAYDALAAAGHLSCAVCGSASVQKALMAPALPARRERTAPETPDTADTPEEARRRAIEALRRKIEAESDYVGMEFAAEARAIHEGDAPERPIYGEARRDDARRLLEDGIPVAPLPFLPRKRTH